MEELKNLNSIVPRIVGYVRRQIYCYRLRTLGVIFGEHLHPVGMPIVSITRSSRILIGNHVVLVSKSTGTALGVNHPVILRTLRPDAELIIGDHVGISGSAICAATRVSVGDYSMFGANVIVTDTDFHAVTSRNRRYITDYSEIQSAETVIGSNVFVGANAIILKGVNIGNNAVIGAGSVVTNNIPASTVAAGNPCRVLRGLSTDGVQ